MNRALADSLTVEVVRLANAAEDGRRWRHLAEQAHEALAAILVELELNGVGVHVGRSGPDGTEDWCWVEFPSRPHGVEAWEANHDLADAIARGHAVCDAMNEATS